MQTIEISDETRDKLEKLSVARDVPLETLVEQAVSAYEGQQISIKEQTRPADGSWPALDAVFGIWKDREEDTFEIIRRIREGE